MVFSVHRPRGRAIVGDAKPSRSYVDFGQFSRIASFGRWARSGGTWDTEKDALEVTKLRGATPSLFGEHPVAALHRSLASHCFLKCKTTLSEYLGRCLFDLHSFPYSGTTIDQIVNI